MKNINKEENGFDDNEKCIQRLRKNFSFLLFGKYICICSFFHWYKGKKINLKALKFSKFYIFLFMFFSEKM